MAWSPLIRRDFAWKRIALAVALTTVGAIVVKPYFGYEIDFYYLWFRLFIVTLVMFACHIAAGAGYDHAQSSTLKRSFSRMQWQFAGLFVGALLGPVVSGLVIGRSLAQMFTVEPMLWGMMFFTAVAATLGVAVGAMLVLRERAARAETEAARAESREHALERQVLEARLKLMQAQIEPHFLFNTLANVQCLVDTDPPLAGRILDSLITYLRASLPEMRQHGSTLKRESEMARAYLTIQQLRMGDRLRFSVDVPAALECTSFPPMILMTLVENAIKHAIDPLQSGGEIHVCAREVADLVEVEVRDTGLGLAKSAGGVGLQNVRERLAALYGKTARLVFEENQPRGVIAKLQLPSRLVDPATAITTENMQ